MLYYAFNLFKLPLWIDTICHAMRSLCLVASSFAYRILSAAAITHVNSSTVHKSVLIVWLVSNFLYFFILKIIV